MDSWRKLYYSKDYSKEIVKIVCIIEIKAVAIFIG